MLLRTQAAAATPPRVYIPHMSEGPMRSGGPCGTKRQARILIVDDEIPLARGIARIVHGMGHKPTTSGPREAMEKFKSSAFDLVISDLNMPGIDGMRLTSMILKVDPSARVIIHTANEQVSKEELIAGGACDILRKPADIAIVRETIERNLRK